ncbi:hypothetical protein LIA77_07818 [Sarocladium implicatum]|nr:hypothetical protein LIA77_07818 [Sarocladium implicatum]
MATLLAPYNTAMQLGTGFNSFTQQVCVNHAVTSTKELDLSSPPEDAKAHLKGADQPDPAVAQDVVYKTSIIDKVTDVTNEMNINAAFAIKYDAFDAKGKVGFVNTSKIKESDVTFLISVKVVNQVIHDHSLTHFQPISGVEANNFTDVYGDCFVSGFQEGGTFTAVISVKAKTEAKAKEIIANAKVKFTKAKDAPKDKGEEGTDAKDGEKKENSVDLGIGFQKDDFSFLRDNETTISVSYTGGGQGLKGLNEDWTFETMRNAALKFPHLVAKTPMRTHAILTKYTALRSYHAHFAGLKMPAFEMAGVYSTILQEAYLDYKTVAKNLQVLAFEVSAGNQKLISAKQARKKFEEEVKAAIKKKELEEPAPASSGSEGEEAAATPDSSSDENENETPAPMANETPAAGSTNEAKKQPENGPYIWKPIVVDRDFRPTLQGVEEASRMVRMMLIRIVQEINILTKFPEAAMDESRVQPHINPFLFKEHLPVGELIVKPSELENAMDPVDKQLESIKAYQGRT